MADAQIQRGLKTAFEYTYRHDDWVSPLEDEWEGLSAEEAAWRPALDAKTIWEIVLHTAVWNENIIERITRGELTRPGEGSWPSMPSEPDEEAWEKAKQRLRRSLSTLEEFIGSVPLEKIEASPYGLPDLLVRYIHIGYHLGQITKLREEIMRKRADSPSSHKEEFSL